jgi:hypothetical protein
MKLAHIFCGCLLSLALPLGFTGIAQARFAGGGGFHGVSGGSAGGWGMRSTNLRQSGNFSHNLQDTSNFSNRPVNTHDFSPNSSWSNNRTTSGSFNNDTINRSNTANINDPNRTINNYNPNRNIYDPNRNITNVSGNTVNIDGNNAWRGGGWYGGGYYVPPGWGWGAAGLATGLAIGSAVKQPPPYYSNVYVGGVPYMYSDGVYLSPQSGSYVVVAPPNGAVVSYLPSGCQALNQNGGQYFSCSGVVYQPFYQNGNVAYQVVSSQAQ